MGEILIRRANFDEIFPLRYEILFPGVDVAKARFNGDDERTTWHIAALCEERVVCCASFRIVETRDGLAWERYGAATRPAFERRGLKERILSFAKVQTPINSGVRRFTDSAA